MNCRTSKNLKLSVIISAFVLFFMMFFSYSHVNALALPSTDSQYHRFKRANITYEEFDKLIRINESDTVKVLKTDNTELGKSELVGTGMKAVYNDKTNLVIIKGDINGDGKATPTDLSKLKQLLVGTAQFEYCYQKAVDMNNDSQITSTDVAQLKMLLVGLPLPEEELDPNDKTPRLDGEIEILRSTTEATHEVTITINWPTGKNLENCRKQVSIDGGKTFKDYEGIIILKENAFVIARYGEPDKMPAGEASCLVDNIDNIAPDDFTFTAKATTSSITVEAKTIDKLKDYTGTLVEGRCSGVQKYLYKLDDGEWQESNVFENLKQDTEYKIYVKAIDYAGNEKEASNNAMTLKTDTIREPGTTGIKVEYSKTTPTNEIVTVTFSIADESLKDNYVIQYQANSLTGEWTVGNVYNATGNCVIYARLADKSGQASKTYVTANVKNIDTLRPLDFTPDVTYNSSTKKTVISAANAKDAPADSTNMCSGLADIYYFTWIYKDGKTGEPSSTPINSNKYEIAGDLINNPDKTNPIIGFYVEVQDKVGNTRTSQVKYIADVDIDSGGGSGGGSGGNTGGGSGGSGGGSGGGGSSGVGRDYNDGPGNKTIQGAEKSYNNPVIPVGFKPVDTPDAKWGPYLPTGWDSGLVIEDRSGNQFIWVPVPCKKGTDPKDAIDKMVLNSRTTCNKEGVTEYKILNDEFPSTVEKETPGEDATGKYGYTYSAEVLYQVKEYQGFYIARYEAGTKSGKLATQKGLETINLIVYDEAKSLAEQMYQNPYVISGLPSGLNWDLLTAWVAKERGTEYIHTTTDGNINRTSFVFSGRYAEGPAFKSGDKRGAYKNGTNVTKPYGKPMLMTTGITDKFKIKNAYDLFGNVWEYTTEQMILNGEKGVNARAGDYYWDATDIKGIYYRGFVPYEDARNEGGFRPMLFLFEGIEMEGYNRTIDGGTASASNPIIPAGYYPIDTGEAKWGDGKRPAVDWNKGLVITDKLDSNGKSIGNEFVWVPVDGTNVKYEKWIERFLNYQETGASEMPESLKKKGYTEEKMVNTFGGFYIARYETSIDSSENTSTKTNQKVKTNISYNQSVELINKYPNKSTSTVGIVTGKQWDTTMKWISNQIGKAKVDTDSSSWGNYKSSLANTGRKSAKNIFDLAGNAWELTSETYGSKIVYRGGSAYNAGSNAPAGYRDAYAKEYSDGATTFRMCLYVEGDNYGTPDVPVPDTGVDITFKQDTTEKAEKVTVTITTNSDKGHIEYAVTPDSTNKQGEWKKGNSVQVTENSTISARVVDDSGKVISAVRTHKVTNIGKKQVGDFKYVIVGDSDGHIRMFIDMGEDVKKESGSLLISRNPNMIKKGFADLPLYEQSQLLQDIAYGSSSNFAVSFENMSKIGKYGFESKYPNEDFSNTKYTEALFNYIDFLYINPSKNLYVIIELNGEEYRFTINVDEVIKYESYFEYPELPPAGVNSIKTYWINVDTYLADTVDVVAFNTYNSAMGAGANDIRNVSFVTLKDINDYSRYIMSKNKDGNTKSYGRYTIRVRTYAKSKFLLYNDGSITNKYFYRAVSCGCRWHSTIFQLPNGYSADDLFSELDTFNTINITDVYPEGSQKKALLGGRLIIPAGKIIVKSGSGTEDDPFILDYKLPIYTYVDE